MTFPDSTSNAWPNYITRIEVQCDYCNDEWSDEAYEDEYDADRDLEGRDWLINTEVNGHTYEHTCSSCLDDLNVCEWCEDWFDHDNSCYCCDISLCSDFCAEGHHEYYFEENPHLAECEECNRPNPKAGEAARYLNRPELIGAAWTL